MGDVVKFVGRDAFSTSVCHESCEIIILPVVRVERRAEYETYQAINIAECQPTSHEPLQFFLIDHAAYRAIFDQKPK